jgi:hypothetical protein
MITTRRVFLTYGSGKDTENGSLLLIIGLIGALFLEVLYPTNFQKAIEHAGDQTAGIKISAFPMHVLISVTWTLLGTIALRYCKALTHIERQYEYLQGLEDKIAPYFLNGTYRREGQKYLNTRTLFPNWGWIFYTYIFVCIVVVATGYCFYIEVTKTTAPLLHYIYDGIAGLAVWLSLVFYKVSQCRDASSAKSRPPNP